MRSSTPASYSRGSCMVMKESKRNAVVPENNNESIINREPVLMMTVSFEIREKDASKKPSESKRIFTVFSFFTEADFLKWSRIKNASEEDSFTKKHVDESENSFAGCAEKQYEEINKIKPVKKKDMRCMQHMLPQE